MLQVAAVPGADRPVVLNVPAEHRGQPVGAHLVESSEVSGRSTEELLEVPGRGVASLAEGRDLIKIDAEGIEAALLADIRPLLLATAPDLVIEVLPEAKALGDFLAALARDARYHLYAMPEYGSHQLVELQAAGFMSATPGRHRAKDVVLTRKRLTRAP